MTVHEEGWESYGPLLRRIWDPFVVWEACLGRGRFPKSMFETSSPSFARVDAFHARVDLMQRVADKMDEGAFRRGCPAVQWKVR